jgi:hypothetical protein
MPTPLPARNIFDGTALPVTSTMKTSMGQLRDYLNDLLGSTGVDADACTALGAYQKSSILGTVSQSAGVPTGAVIERGSNANGSYVRFADGLQICTRNATRTTTITAALGSVFVDGSPPAALVTAVAFVTAPLCFINLGLTGSAVWPGAAVGSTTTAFPQFYLISGSSVASATYATDLFAIGRWF